MRQNIPLELRQYPQWVCAGPNKIPLSPRTGQPASVTDPSTWATFDEACRTGAPNVGFVLTDSDPFTIIDLDNKPTAPLTQEQWAVHQRILAAFESYTERSTSGQGFHIITRGRIPAALHRDGVEVYSTARYMICTGNVVRNAPVVDCQALLDVLVGEMRPAPEVELVDSESSLTDEDVFEMAINADNGAKFDELCRGDWRAMGYPSQSEADFALLSILAFYTTDNEQVRRLFRDSALGRRPKARQDNRYLNTALRKIRAKQPPPIDLSALMKAPPPAPPSATCSAPAVRCATCERTIELPPGLVGELASYIYRTAVRPVPEIALAAALALTAGIAGRCYNVSGTGLNQYIILLAQTGTGKEGVSIGIDRLVAAVRQTIPMVDSFIGPSAFASGQALIKRLDEQHSFVSILGEFGFTLQQLCDPRANSAQVMLKRVLLDLYAKSGWNSVMRSSVYSDTEKNTKTIQAPNVSILGESTPGAFFEGLDSSHIAEGLIPRFLVLEYTGPRPPRNRNTAQPPEPELVTRLGELCAIALTMQQNNTCANVTIDPQALAQFDTFDVQCDNEINATGSDTDKQIWNRAHLKALKLGALLAVGCNPNAPVVTQQLATWSIDFVKRDVQTMTTRFATGDVGVGEQKHESDIRRAVEMYLAMAPHERLQYKTPKNLLDKPVVPFHYLRRKLRLLAAFKCDRRGPAKALADSLADMVNAEILQQIPLAQAQTQFQCRSPLYVKGSTW